MGHTFACAALICCGVAFSKQAPQPIDYSALYAKGVTFAAFLDAAESQSDEWRARYRNAAVSADTVSRLRALPARRHLLVVAEDFCSDSIATVPYLARLVDASPDGSQCASSTLARAGRSWKPIGHPTAAQRRLPSPS